MALSGKEFQEIQVALLDGYRDLFDLRQMVRFGLDESLDSIAGGRDLNEQVFNLVEWADSHGRVLDLVRSAYEYNQGNETLKKLYDAWIEPSASVTAGQLSIVTSQTAQVFLSYSHQDTDSMLFATQKMDQQGVSVWTSEGLEPGTSSWQAAIESALRNTECMVVLLSPDAKQSEWVEREIAVTQRLGRRIFPVLIRGTHDEAVPFSLETVQYIDARYEYQSALENRLVPSVVRYLSVAASAVRGQQVEISPSDMPSDESDDGSGGVAELVSTREESVVEAERPFAERTEDVETAIASLRKPVDVPIQPSVAHESVHTEYDSRQETKQTVDTGLGSVEIDDGRDKVVGDRPVSESSQKPSRSWIRIIVGVIIFVGIVTGIVMVQREASLQREAEVTREAGKFNATQEVEQSIATHVSKATATAQLAGVKMTASAIQVAVSPDEFAGIPFVYVSEGEFWIMQTEVTNEMYQRFIDAGGYSEENRNVYWSDEGGQWRAENVITEPGFWDDSEFNQEQKPVVGVSLGLNKHRCHQPPQ